MMMMTMMMMMMKKKELGETETRDTHTHGHTENRKRKTMMKTKRKDETAQVCFPKLYISLPSFFFFLRSFTNYLFEKERRIETLESHHRPSPIFLYIPFFFLYLFKKKIRRKEKSLTALVFIC
jgi:hypothetical protein